MTVYILSGFIALHYMETVHVVGFLLSQQRRKYYKLLKVDSIELLNM